MAAAAVQSNLPKKVTRTVNHGGLWRAQDVGLHKCLQERGASEGQVGCMLMLAAAESLAATSGRVNAITYRHDNHFV
jgi:hypothetical protein